MARSERTVEVGSQLEKWATVAVFVVLAIFGVVQATGFGAVFTDSTLAHSLAITVWMPMGERC